MKSTIISEAIASYINEQNRALEETLFGLLRERGFTIVTEAGQSVVERVDRDLGKLRLWLTDTHELRRVVEPAPGSDVMWTGNDGVARTGIVGSRGPGWIRAWYRVDTGTLRETGRLVSWRTYGRQRCLCGEPSGAATATGPHHASNCPLFVIGGEAA